MKSLRAILKKGFDFSGNNLHDNPEFFDLLGRMLEMNPGRRISPSSVMKHQFLG